MQLIPQLFPLQNINLLWTDQVKMGKGRAAMDVTDRQAVLPAPLLQFGHIAATDFGNGFAIRETGIQPIMGEKGDLSPQDSLFPLIQFRAGNAKSQLDSPVFRDRLPRSIVTQRKLQVQCAIINMQVQ